MAAGRAAYGSARHDWPETPASEWAKRPQTFADSPPGCRPTRFLEAGDAAWFGSG